MPEPNVAELAGDLTARGVQVLLDESLARHTTIGVGGPAELFAQPRDVEQAEIVVDRCRVHDVPLKVLGAGSNLLVSENGVRGLVVHTKALQSVEIGPDGVVEAGAGCHFPALVRKTAAEGWRGLEAGVGIPGSLGGVLTMNAGAYQFSIGPLVREVDAVSRARGRVRMPREAIDFRYRASSFGEDLIVASATITLAKDDAEAIRRDMNEHMRFRKETQPVGVKSAGCIFKNPQQGSAGKLLDELGLKGFRVGAVRISDVHANFIVHDGDGRASEVMELIDRVRERVLAETSIELETEVMTWN